MRYLWCRYLWHVILYLYLNTSIGLYNVWISNQYYFTVCLYWILELEKTFRIWRSIRFAHSNSERYEYNLARLNSGSRAIVGQSNPITTSLFRLAWSQDLKYTKKRQPTYLLIISEVTCILSKRPAKARPMYQLTELNGRLRARSAPVQTISGRTCVKLVINPQTLWLICGARNYTKHVPLATSISTWLRRRNWNKS